MGDKTENPKEIGGVWLILDTFPWIYGILAGASGVCGAIFGKLGFDSESVLANRFGVALCEALWVDGSLGPDSSSTCITSVSYLARGIALLLCFGMNAMMLAFFLRALDRTTSVTATVLCTGANIIFSGLSAWVFFGENLSGKYVSGAFFIVLGMSLIAYSSVEVNAKPTKD